jgi:hypothetical protein
VALYLGYHRGADVLGRINTTGEQAHALSGAVGAVRAAPATEWMLA